MEAGKFATAKVFMHGRSQAVRLPKEFRFQGTEVRVTRAGDKVILEPLDSAPLDIAAWRARLDAYLETPFPDVDDEAPLRPDETLSFD